MTCRHCMDAGDFFGEGIARRELKRYRRRGPGSSTGRLLDLLAEARADGAPVPEEDGPSSDREGGEGPGVDLLDIGGGVGALQHELVARGARRVVAVDAAPAYLAAIDREAKRRGTRDRFTLLEGDAVERAEELPRARVVTLDRVLCCYPDMPALVAASAGRARHFWGVVYPREWWGARMGVALVNLWQRLRGRAFRVYLHGPDAIAREARRHGLRRVRQDRTLLWRVELYARVSPEDGSGTAPSTTTAAAM